MPYNVFMCFIEDCPALQVCEAVRTGNRVDQLNKIFVDAVNTLIDDRKACVVGLACVRVYEEKCGLSASNPHLLRTSGYLLEKMDKHRNFSDYEFDNDIDKYAEELEAKKNKR